MATMTTPNEFKFESGKGANNFSSHVYKLMLMADGFVFNKDTHGTVEDVAASEITSAGGYARKTLVVDSAWAQDDANDKAVISWVDVTFTPSGAAFDDFCAAIIYNDTHAGDLIVGCIAFDATLTVPDGQSYQIQNISKETT
ncbi:MAG: hypothetical protein WBN66_02295 [Smithella sp.]